MARQAEQAGRPIARIRGLRRAPARLEIHHKYLTAARIGDFGGRRSGNYRNFDVHDALAEVYAANLNTMLNRARTYVGREEDVELRLPERNDRTAAASATAPMMIARYRLTFARGCSTLAIARILPHA